MNLTEFVTRARAVSVPLIAVSTPDPGATFQALKPLAGEAPCFDWRASKGALPANAAARQLASQIGGDVDTWLDRTGNPAEFLALAQQLPAQALIAMHQGHRVIEADPRNVQAVWDCRDTFKQNNRTLVLMGPGFRLPAELSNDVLTFDEQLPDRAQLAQIVTQCYTDAELGAVPEATLAAAIPALTGLAAFTAEQITAMSLRKAGLDVPALWDRKRAMVNQQPGLSVYSGPETFDSIGGCEAIKGYLSALLRGPRKPGAIVFIDEIEKALGSAGFDTSGVSQDQHQALLTWMQDHDARGMIFLGHPGTAKSAIAKAAANVAGIPNIQLDLGGNKSSLVGSSEAMIRNNLKVIDAVSGGNALFLATCNGIASLSPELRRRFNRGTFFFDLPTAAERTLIWDIYDPEAKQQRPPDNGWTGAEIRACAMTARDLGITLLEASAYIVPISQSAADRVQALRKQAAGNYLSASTPGIYQAESFADAPSLPRRGITLAPDFKGGNA